MISLNLTIIITVINFGVLFWLFRKFLLTPLVEYLDKRADEIAVERSESKSDREKARGLFDEAQGRLRQARLEAGDIVKEARLEGQKEQAKIVEKAQEAAGRTVEKAREEIEKRVEEARAQLKREVGGLSLDIAEKLLERSVSVEDHERAVAEFMEQLKEKE